MEIRTRMIIRFLLLWSSTGIAGQTPFVSDVSNVGICAATFLNMGVGARANAMGGAYTAIASDASALFWNPAGMPRIPRPAVTVNHIDWFLDIYHEFVGAVIPAGRHAFGAAITYLGVPDQVVRTIEQPEGNGNFYNASDLALALSYGLQITDQFSLGFTAKFVHERIYNTSGSAGAVDFGAFYQPGHFKWLTLGMQIANFGSDLRLTGQDVKIQVDTDPAHKSNERISATLDTDAWSLPLIFRFGLAATPLQTKLHRVITAIDLIHPSNNTESVNLGLEYTFWGTFALRAGFHSLFERDYTETGGFTFGGGVNLFTAATKITLDYAWRDFGVLNHVSRITVGIEY